MVKRILLSLGLSLILGLLLPGGGAAQEPSAVSWQARYWNNEDLAGTPVLERQESNVDYNWGNDAPAPEVPQDHFSARWTRTIFVEPGTYRFTATSDDGMRVWVDGQLIVDEWYDHPIKTVSTDLYLEAGPHQVRVDYYEDSGGAIARLAWSPIDAPTTSGWRGEYFNNENLEGDPRVVRNDPQINFNWGTSSPVPGQIEPNEFSVRWSQTFNPPTPGLYRFVMTVDDGGRLWVNNQLLINAWAVQAPTSYQEDIYLDGGPVPIRMEYFDNEVGAIAQLRWMPVTQVAANWRGEYFRGTDLTGPPVFTQGTDHIDFDWGAGAPAAAGAQLSPNHFSARWERTLNLPAGLYCFGLATDDGGRLWVNGRLIIGAWEVQSPRVQAMKVELPGGMTSMRVEYFENTGLAQAKMGWFRFDPDNLDDAGDLGVQGFGFLPDDPGVAQGIIDRCKHQPILNPAL